MANKPPQMQYAWLIAGLIVLIMVLYANQSAEFARNGQFTAFLSRLETGGAMVLVVDRKNRSLEKIDLSRSDATFQEIKTLLQGFSGYRCGLLLVSSEEVAEELRSWINSNPAVPILCVQSSTVAQRVERPNGQTSLTSPNDPDDKR